MDIHAEMKLVRKNQRKYDRVIQWLSKALQRINAQWGCNLYEVQMAVTGW